MNQDMRMNQARDFKNREYDGMTRDTAGCNSIMEYALPFAAWELRLYLNTHPCDERALAAYRQLCAANGRGKCNYACATDDASGGCGCDGKVWRWIDDPWPWELEANRTGGDK